MGVRGGELVGSDWRWGESDGSESGRGWGMKGGRRCAAWNTGIGVLRMVLDWGVVEI